MALTAVLATMGTVAGIAMALAPVPTMKTINDTKSLGDFSAFPYIATFCQCVLWMSYAGVTPGKTALIPVNVFVSIVELSYCVLFLKFVTALQRNDLLRTLSYPLIATIVGISLSLISPSPSKFLGFFAVISNIVMYGAPLAVVKTVIETKSVKYMPFLLSFIGTIASLVWSAWGLSAGDSFVLVPNLLGVMLGLIQLAVYFKFRNSSDTDGIVLSYYSPRGTVEEGHANQESEHNNLVR
jgi:solute carrier family 50 protein (sugar transporter)